MPPNERRLRVTDPRTRADRDRPADGRAVRQAAAHASRCEAHASRASTWCRICPASAWTKRCCACCACPRVGSKNFLITIGDRTVGGLNSRDPMVGPWQVPVADCAVTIADFDGYAGEAMAMAERAPVALLDAAPTRRGWPWARRSPTWLPRRSPVWAKSGCRRTGWRRSNHPGEDAALFDAVQRGRHGVVPGSSDISIPVGKDSLSMQTVWQRRRTQQRTVSPVSLVDHRLRARHRRAPHADAAAASSTAATPNCG